MITMSSRAKERSRAGSRLACTALACTALAMTVLVSGCGSGGHAASSGAAAGSGATASAVKQTCQQLSGVLANGPDSDADPVGYAEAQVLPLQQIHTSDPTLNSAISALATDYQSFSAAHGTGSAVKSALTTAVNRINSLCPGLGATA